MKTKGRQIKTLHQLAKAASERRAVTLSLGWNRRVPAAVVLNHQAGYVLKLIDAGIFIYNGKRRVDLTKPPRKWIPYVKGAPKPILLLENK
jgi:hypothetical protein